MRERRIIGKIDCWSGGFLRGWVFDPSYPKRRQSVDIFAGPVLLARAACGFYRADLEAAGFGDGRHEFMIALDALESVDASALEVRVISAPNVVMRPGDSSPSQPTRAGSASTCVKAYFEALLAGLPQDDRKSRPARSRDRRLTGIERHHGVPLSLFAVHIAHKFECDLEHEAGLQSFLRFYFERYAPHQAPFRVPLSAEESRHWAAALPGHACRGAASFAPSPKKAGEVERSYAWVVNDAPRLGVEDCWIEERLVVFLQSFGTVLAKWREFPMNRFLRGFATQTAALAGLRQATVADRQTLYAAVMLHAIRLPHLRALLPSPWMDRMLEPDGEGVSRLARVLARVLRYQPDLRRLGLAGEQEAVAPAAAADATTYAADVQLVGPFDRILGLGESCRRLGQALAACGYRVAFANYDIGNASPEDRTNAISSMLVRARVNVLHLNLEEIPEALAFSLASVLGSYLIAVPYYELSATAKCHERGLDLIDEIWAPSRFLQNLFGARCAATHLMPLPLRADFEVGRDVARARVLEQADRADPITLFLSTADALSWLGRKHMLGVIDAFQAAFVRDEPVCLLLKTHNTDRMADAAQRAIWATIIARSEQDPRIVIINKTISDDDYRALLTGVDCLVSLHRSEGLGLDILDAMALGTAVVATAYSGNADICDETTSWPVAFDLVPVGKGHYPFAEPHHVWAEPRLPDAVVALREVHARPKERRHRAAQARSKVAKRNGLRETAERIRLRLQDILAAVGN